MLDRIREGSQGIAAKVILGLVILTFAISGIGSYINSKADTAVKSVNGVEITQTALEEAFQNERNRMKQQFGDVVEQLMADESYVANFKAGILDRLVVEELQRQQAKDLGIRVSDEQIKTTIVEMPEFQRNGQFDNEVYLALLRQAGFTPLQFRDYLRQQMTRSQYTASLMGSEFVLDHEKEQYASLNNQTRTYSQALVSSKTLEASVQLTEEEIQAYYDNNKFSYKTADKVAIEYLFIDANALANAVDVNEEQLNEYYQQNIVEFTQQEQRRIAHILVEAGDNAQQKIEEAKAKLDAGDSFESVVKAFSEDSFSAENGGDLEWFEKGIFGDAFDSAVLSLEKAGDISDVFESESGFHIVKLTDYVKAETTPFEEVKETIASQLQQLKIDELYIEAQTKVSELAFEIPDTLEDAAEVAGLELKSTELKTANELQGLLGSQVAVSKAFDETFISEGLNSDLIEINDTTSLVLRVTDNQPARIQKLDEIKIRIEAALTREKAAELASQKALELAERVKSGEAITSLADNAVVVTENTDIARFDATVNANIRDAVFELAKPVNGQAEVSTVETSNGDAAVVSLTSFNVKPAAVEEPVANQVLNVVGQQAIKALIEASKNNADIE
ncbi:peptidylprolyl isomerase [Psychrosphaera haliotis]|uniref:SurA N-terminal domain-containing protein n=1 Tax=Psychrosphaera haliotis TaxID=555083 RepID=UPI0031D0FF43